MDRHLVIELITVPLFTGAIGYITNWTGVLMLFTPLEFRGFRMPGLRILYPMLPRRVQVLPLFTEDGRLGYQGMVPSRCEKMASLAIDKSLSKIGRMSDFYHELDPDTIIAHLTTVAGPEIPRFVDEIAQRGSPAIWNSLPDFAKDYVYDAVREQLPQRAGKVADEFAAHLDELIDAKSMAIRFLTKHPALLNDIFRTFGAKELRFMQNFGFYFGYPMGFALVGMLQLWPYWWLLPVGGTAIGWIVNYTGLMIIFEPADRKLWVPWRQGLLLKRRDEVIEGFAQIISRQVLTIDNIVDELLHGPRSDRTTQLLNAVLHDTVEQAIGRARIAVKVAVGTKEYDRMLDAVLPGAIGFLPVLTADEQFIAEQTDRIGGFVAVQMGKLSNTEFQQVLRSAVKQDEWLLFVHGGMLGALAGFLHLALFGV
ncbi:hypothetical protein [Nocardia sp. NBC_01388]|uniref:hypothetical protein n=1 Tax=Nocardia sp. NBC_01388 TaxID=2903596 RepID=UPI003243C32F